MKRYGIGGCGTVKLWGLGFQILPEHLGLNIAWWKQLGKILARSLKPGSYLALPSSLLLSELESLFQLVETERAPRAPLALINSLKCPHSRVRGRLN